MERSRVVGILSLSVAVLTLITSVFLALLEMNSDQISSLDEKIESLVNLSVFFYLGYISSLFVTIFSVAMFAGFFVYCRAEHNVWSTIAFSFVPIYGLGNTIVYSSQVFVLPHILHWYNQPDTMDIAKVLYSLLIHNWYGTAMEALNSISYAILGIPSIIFAVILFQKEKKLRIGSIFLAISGVLSFATVIGVAIQNTTLGIMTIPSGIVYMISSAIIGLFFLRNHSYQGL